MASVRKRDPKDPASPWVCEYTDEAGKRRRYTPKTGLKKDADAFRRKVEGELERGEHVAASETATVATACRDWIDDCERRARRRDGLTLGSWKMYDSQAKTILGSDIAGVLLSELDTRRMQQFVDGLAERYSPKTINHIAMGLKLVLDYAVERRWLPRNLMRDKERSRRIRLPAVERTTAIPPKAVLLTILRRVGERFGKETAHAALVRAALVNLVLHAGFRPGEVSGLKWEHVDLDRGVLRVRHSYGRYDGLKGPKSKAGLREVALVDPIRDALKALRDSAAEGRTSSAGTVFTSRTGRVINGNNLVTTYWTGYMRNLGLMKPTNAKGEERPLYRLYDLRHAAASLRIERGLSVLHIKTFMGHAKVNTTIDVYGHLFPEDETMKRAAADIAASLDPALNATIASV